MSLPRALLLPPFTLFALCALGGWLVRRGRRRAGWSIVGVGAGALVLLSLPLVGDALLRGLEERRVFDPAALGTDSAALVVLSAGIEPESPEYGRGSLDALTLERVRYGAVLQRASGLALLVTGGVQRPDGVSVAEEMARVLTEELDVPVRWVEPRALDTRQNALYSAELLRAEGISTVVLVTHAWHLRRARLAFEAAGLRVLPAPTRFQPPFRFELALFVPSAKGLQDSVWALHELLGLVVYRLGLR